MSDRPILFCGPMIRALLDGRKTQTRRVLRARFGRRSYLPEFCGGKGDWNDPTCWGWEDHDAGDWITLEKDPGQRMGWRDLASTPHVGDRLWVREAHTFTRNGMTGEINQGSALYRADATDNTGARWPTVTPDDPDREVKWRSPIHMPRWASRLTLVVTDVRVQRLQDILLGDCYAEGCTTGKGEADNGSLPKGWVGPWAEYRELWNSLHGPDAWDANPWVSATTFTVHRCNVDQMPPEDT